MHPHLGGRAEGRVAVDEVHCVVCVKFADFYSRATAVFSTKAQSAIYAMRIAERLREASATAARGHEYAAAARCAATTIYSTIRQAEAASASKSVPLLLLPQYNCIYYISLQSIPSGRYILLV
jgi:hypothetical protein